MPEYFNPDAVIQWHNTNERFDVAGFVKANCNYPGSWQSDVERLEILGDLLITVCRVWNKEGDSFHVCSFIQLQNGKISRIDEYWGDDGEAPDWHSALHLSKSIK